MAAACALGGEKARALSDDEALDVMDHLEEAQRAIDAARLDLVAEVDFRDLAPHRFGHRTPAWLGHRFGWPAGKAKDAVRTGRKLRLALPEVADALAAGLINADHASVMARAANPRIEAVIAGCQQELISLAQGVRFERFRQDVMALADLADADGGHDPTADQNTLSLTDGTGGELHLKGTLVGDLAASVRGALGPMIDALFRRHRSDREKCPELPAPTRAQLQAEALGELVRRGHASDTSATRAPVVDVTLVMHADRPGAQESLLGSRLGRCTTVSGIRFANRTVQLLACDATVHGLIMDSFGVPLDLGTAVRFGTQAQRRAVAVRDGGCVFPGCDAPPSWTDLHHVIPAGPNGPTDLWNLASLCRHHHGVVHSRGWGMRSTDDQCFEFRTSTGVTLASQRHGRIRAGPPGP